MTTLFIDPKLRIVQVVGVSMGSGSWAEINDWLNKICGEEDPELLSMITESANNCGSLSMWDSIVGDWIEDKLGDRNWASELILTVKLV